MGRDAKFQLVKVIKPVGANLGQRVLELAEIQLDVDDVLVVVDVDDADVFRIAGVVFGGEIKVVNQVGTDERRVPARDGGTQQGAVVRVKIVNGELGTVGGLVKLQDRALQETVGFGHKVGSGACLLYTS